MEIKQFAMRFLIRDANERSVESAIGDTEMINTSRRSSRRSFPQANVYPTERYHNRTNHNNISCNIAFTRVISNIYGNVQCSVISNA